MLDVLEELESDLSRFHRVDDIYSASGPRVFRLARQVVHYEGAVYAAAVREQRAQQPAPPPSSSPPGRPAGGDVREVPSVRAALNADPAFAGLIDWG